MFNLMAMETGWNRWYLHKSLGKNVVLQIQRLQSSKDNHSAFAMNSLFRQRCNDVKVGRLGVLMLRIVHDVIRKLLFWLFILAKIVKYHRFPVHLQLFVWSVCIGCLRESYLRINKEN